MNFTGPQRFLLESDDRLRALERMAALGDPDAIAAYKARATRHHGRNLNQLMDDTTKIFSLELGSGYRQFTNKLMYSDDYKFIVELAETIRDQVDNMRRRIAVSGEVSVTNKQLRKLLINLIKFTGVKGEGTSRPTLYPKPGGKWSDSPEADDLLDIIDGFKLLI